MSARSLQTRRFHGRILHSDGYPVGTCFQVRTGVLVTALHVVHQAGGGGIGGVVQFEPLEAAEGQTRATATLVASDSEHDLAILTTSAPLESSVELVALSDDQLEGLPISLTGYAVLPPAESYLIMTSTGHWEGRVTSDTGAAAGWVRADGVHEGMSGAPLIRQHDGAVIGVLTDRYQADAGGWSSGRVRTARTEQLLDLLSDRAAVAVESRTVRQLKAVDRLTDETLDREAIRGDETFVAPKSWEEERGKARAALRRGDVLVVVAPPGIGSTTFARQLLAHEAPANMPISTFEPDWERPTISALRPKPGYAHILDVEAPDDIEQANAFVAGLTELAGSYRDMLARLVLTVRTEFWRAMVSGPVAGVHVIQLDDAPDSLTVVERWVGRKAPAVVPHLTASEVEPHLRDLSAVQAASAASRILEAWKSWDPEDDSRWSEHLHELLDNHGDELNELFIDATPKAAESGTGPLNPDDRCFLLALACLGSARLPELESASKSLAARLQDVPPDKVVKETAFEVFGGRGLAGRVGQIRAKVLPGEIVVFERPDFGDAAARYAWDNFPAIRKPVAEWLIGLAAKDAGRRIPVRDRLTELVLRNQDVGFIKNDLMKSVTAKTRWLLEDILLAGAKDPHMRSGCERILYAWATNPDLQDIVVTVAGRLLLDGNRTEIAVRRLQRVADAKPDLNLAKTVQDTFETALQEPAVRETVVAMFAKWLTDDASTPAAKIALRALMAADTGNVPWLLTEQAAGIDLTLVLREALADQVSHPALVAILSKASADDARYSTVVDATAGAAAGLGTLAPLRLVSAFTGHTFNGRDPEADILAKLKVVVAGDAEPSAAAPVA